jgi:hypothetical protein
MLRVHDASAASASVDASSEPPPSIAVESADPASDPLASDPSASALDASAAVASTPPSPLVASLPDVELHEAIVPSAPGAAIDATIKL